ncbi:MAG: trypsin-like peptidase domain-containing protein [Ruminococcus sp.]|nr:trypsin-like peptidase domain-containing protein [Ruminococcus sp.]
MSDKFDEYNEQNSVSEDTGHDYGNSYAYVSNNSVKPKKKKNHSVLKAVALFLSFGIVAGVSIQGYKIYKGEDEKNTLSEFNALENESSSTESTDADRLSSDDNDNADVVSLFQLAARTDAKPIPEIVDSIMPSFVGISSTFEVSYNGWGGTVNSQQMQGTGTGIIMTEDGYIATNAHVVYDNESQYAAGQAVEVSVLYSDESVHEAKIIAYDLQTDLAVLKVDETGLTPAVFGDSDDLKVGELVIAVGNPLGFELFGTVTSGIVSALDRQVTIGDKNMTLIQTDAPINSGNSGGPLLNSCGQVIGINSAKMSSSYGSASIEGLGFAIPINDARTIINDLINYKYVKGRPYMGISTTDITESYSRYLNLPMGAYVNYVEEGGAADFAGIQEGDVIIGVEDETVSTGAELAAIVYDYKAGDSITLTVSRRGKDIEITMILQERKQPEQ